jgi:hypothetical protein
MQKDRSRFCLWPIRFSWKRKSAGKFFDRHGWQVGSEPVALADTSWGCMPGYRDVFGQTFHIGAFKIMCGPIRQEERFCCFVAPQESKGIEP